MQPRYLHFGAVALSIPPRDNLKRQAFITPIPYPFPSPYTPLYSPYRISLSERVKSTSTASQVDQYWSEREPVLVNKVYQYWFTQRPVWYI